MHLRFMAMSDAFRKHSSLALLALLVAGWVVAPAVHQIEHALEWTPTEHTHACEEGGFSEAHAHATASTDDCTLCLARNVLEMSPAQAPDRLDVESASDSPPAVSMESPALGAGLIRGPPIAT